MKKFSIWKKLQLVLILVLTVVSIYLAVSDQLFYQDMLAHPAVLGVFITMWFLLLMVYAFMFADFFFLARLKADYSYISETAYSDQLSGIPNRFSCDIVLEKYKNTCVPANMACVMLEITNLEVTNADLGHYQGNRLIKAFSDILSNSALALCFVGRNGGNKFLAIFEECTAEQVELFLERIATRIAAHNQSDPANALSYHFGTAMNIVEGKRQVHELVAIANNRLGK